MTAEPQHTYGYDAENRMTAVDTSVAKYVYDANGLRVRKTFNGIDTYYVFSGTKVAAEYDVSGGQTTAIREYIYSGSQLVATLASDGQGANTATTYHHPDHLSVRVNTNAGGSKAGEQAHLPFGDLWYSFDSTSKWRFTTYERDGESDNDYATFRSYVNRLGRFSSPDARAGAAANPQTLNRYAYVINAPGTYVDPLGLDICWNIDCNDGGWGFNDFLSFMANKDEMIMDSELISTSMGEVALRSGAGIEGHVPFGERLIGGLDPVLGAIYGSSDVVPVLITGPDLPETIVYFRSFLATPGDLGGFRTAATGLTKEKLKKKKCLKDLDALGITASQVWAGASAANFINGVGSTVPLSGLYSTSPYANVRDAGSRLSGSVGDYLASNPRTAALSQLGGHDIYVNPGVAASLTYTQTMGVVFHEVVHNITGLTDPDIQRALQLQQTSESHNITQKLMRDCF